MTVSTKLLSSAILVAAAEAAGMTAHNVGARRASQFEYFGPKTDEFNPASFYDLANDRSDAIQAGSPFPDFLYACGDEHDAGEEAHWTPFQIASVNYIREKYPNWSTESRLEDGPGLVAFTMGVTSHYIMDINWHGLEVIPDGEGLIRTMGYADFNCTEGHLCDEAHSGTNTNNRCLRHTRGVA
jgi:glycosylphosphatidylinositol phospholipase D